MKAEWELVQRARQGDEESFAALVEQNQGRIYNLALRMTGNPDDALELSQEAFLNAWKGLGKFQGDSSFATWLYRLTSNVCIDFLRREKRRNALSMTISLDDEEEARQAELPDERFSPHVEAERRERLVKAGALDDPLLDYARQFARADQILIAAPCWDLSFPAVLRAYLERVSVTGVTFHYNDQGVPAGLCRARRLCRDFCARC